MNSNKEIISEVFPLLWSDNVAQIVDWAISALDLTESWRAPDDGSPLEHVELLWPGGRVSVNINDAYAGMGPSGIALRVDDPARVDALYERARKAGAEILRGPEDSRIAYSFTAQDPDGNQWWVHAENGFLDQLRS